MNYRCSSPGEQPERTKNPFRNTKKITLKPSSPQNSSDSLLSMNAPPKVARPQKQEYKNQKIFPAGSIYFQVAAPHTKNQSNAQIYISNLRSELPPAGASPSLRSKDKLMNDHLLRNSLFSPFPPPKLSIL